AGWLLIKGRDAEARDPDDAPLVERAPHSVLTGRDLDAVGRDADRVWSSEHGERDAPAPPAPGHPHAPAGPKRTARAAPDPRTRQDIDAVGRDADRVWSGEHGERAAPALPAPGHHRAPAGTKHPWRAAPAPRSLPGAKHTSGVEPEPHALPGAKHTSGVEPDP